MTVLWNQVLNRFNVCSQFLQKVEIDMNITSSMLRSLIDFIANLRQDFVKIKNEAKNLSSVVNQEYSDLNKRKIIKKFTDGEKEAENLSGSDKFRIQTFYFIIDKLLVELKKRSDAYNHITNLFGFLSKLPTADMNEIKKSANNLINIYSEDLQDTFIIELEQFISLVKLLPKGFFSNNVYNNDKNECETLCALKVLNWIIDSKVDMVFPNVCIAYRIFVTIPIANCEAERSFSVLKRIKNVHRVTMLNNRLSALASLSIEGELLRLIDFDELIEEFASEKLRKKCFG